MATEKSPAKRNTIARTLLMYLTELRKAEADARKQSTSITKALVLDWFRGLESTEQAQFVRELQQLTTKRSGLA